MIFNKQGTKNYIYFHKHNIINNVYLCVCENKTSFSHNCNIIMYNDYVLLLYISSCIMTTNIILYMKVYFSLYETMCNYNNFFCNP